MKNWVRVLALSLALVMVLGVSAAFADAYTIPKTLKNVEGLPENPEVPELKTINDGKTETVTVVSGQLVSLSANWNNELVPLTLTDGAVSFDITGKIVQLGMEGKTRTVSREETLYTEKKLDKTHYYYTVTKNEDGTYKFHEHSYDTTSVGYSAYPYTATLKIPTDPVTVKGEKTDWNGSVTDYAGRTIYYEDYKEPYVGVRYPGYEYDYPVGLFHEDESYSLIEEYWDEDKQEWVDLTDDETGKIANFDENGNYPVHVWPAEDVVYFSDWQYIESGKDEDLVKFITQEQYDAMIAAGVNPDDVGGWHPGLVYYNEYGWVRGMYHVTERQFWAEDINGYGKAFEGKTADGWTVGYNRKGAACEKSIEMTGVDFFQSETAPSKVTVSWQSGKNMYNKTVWYISKISQEYANEIVTASFAQGGQWNGIKKEAK